MNYNFVGKNRKETPQNKPIPGRESEMKKNLAGGYSFKASDWTALRRWLLVGSMSGAYYQGKEEMTEANIKVLNRCIKANASKVGEEIIDASKKGTSVHTPIFALVVLSMGDASSKNVFRDIFNSVIRTASHLYEFTSYVKDMRGFGSVIHKAVNGWLDAKEAKELEYQLLKYQNRNGWTHADILRKFKPKTEDVNKNSVYKWAVGKGFNIVEANGLNRIAGYEILKSASTSEDAVILMINDLKLTHEMIPANIKRTTGIWEALFHNMPVGATIRNLGNLTEKGIFKNVANLDLLEKKLSKENLAKAYIHPINFASALLVYQSGGHLGRSKLTWNTVPRILDIMNQGIQDCFEVLEPTGKQFFYALDVSGSMTGNMVGNMWLAPYQVAGILALASVKSEKNYFVGGFDTRFKVLQRITKNCSYSEIVDWGSGVWPGNFGGTNASVAYDYAIKNDIFADVFVFVTDSESWTGHRHPSQALKEYRSKINPNAKSIYITLVPYSDRVSLVDPKDPRSYDVASFTSQTPKMIQMVANDEI